MKDITDELRIKISEEFRKLGDERLVYGGIRIPRSIARAMLNFGRKYEAESIQDIRDNYHQLIKCNILPLHLLSFGLKFCNQVSEDVVEGINQKRIYYPVNIQSFPPAVGFNLCNLDSVRVSEINHIPKKNSQERLKFKAIEFKVYDKFENLMPAVFVYEDRFDSSVDEYNTKQLKDVFFSTELDTFDVWFLGLDEKVKGKRLEVLDIKKNKLENEKIPEEPEESEGVYPDLEGRIERCPCLLGVF